MKRLLESLRLRREMPYPVVDVEKTVFHCVGIAVIGGALFWILGGKKEGKD